MAKSFCITLVILFVAWAIQLEVSKFFSNVALVSSTAERKVSSLSDELLVSIKKFKEKGRYDFGMSKEKSYFSLTTLRNELYAQISPAEFLSHSEFKASDNELKSLLFIEDKGFLFRNITISSKGLLRAIYFIQTKGNTT